MGRAHRGGGQVVEYEVAVGHRVQRVLGHRREAELLGNEAAVGVEVHACQGAGAQWQLARHLEHEGEAARVAVELPEPGQQVVRQIHGLRALKVRVAGHGPVEVARGEVEHHVHQVEQSAPVTVSVCAHEQRDIGGHLVVARACRVELAAHRPGDLGKAPLDRHVDVLVVGMDLEAVVLDLLQHLRQASLDGLQIVGRDDLLARQHARVRERLLDVVRREPVVEADRGVERAEQRVLRLGEAGHGAAV